jgi:MFS family permease
MVVTDDNNHDFFSGIDYILSSAGRIITPFLIGLYIGQGTKLHWFSSVFAYRSTLILAFILVLLITFACMRVNHKSVPFGRFLHLHFARPWQDVRYLLMTLGFFQAAMYVVPTVFIMKFVGGESAVGSINSVGYLIAIVLLYLISSRSGIKERTKIIFLGFLMLMTGTVAFSVFLLRNAVLGTYILVFLMFLAEPMLSFPVRATFLKAINTMKIQEKREEYSYILDVEAFTAIGRISSLIIFYLLYLFLPVNYSLTLYIMLIAVIQYICIPLSKKINGC